MEFHTQCFKLLAFDISNRRQLLCEISMGKYTFVLDGGAAMKHKRCNEKYGLEKFLCNFNPIDYLMDSLLAAGFFSKGH